MDFSDYGVADTTHVYYYTLTRDAFTKEEHRAQNRKYEEIKHEASFIPLLGEIFRQKVKPSKINK